MRFDSAQSSQAEIQRLESALREMESRYRLVLQAAAEGIWTLDARDKIEEINARGAAMLGYAVDEMVNRSAIDFVFAADRSAFAHEIHECRGGVRPPRELRLRRKDGSVLWVSLSASPLSTHSDSPPGLILLLTDVTEQKQMGQSLQELLNQRQVLKQDMSPRGLSREAKRHEGSDRLATEIDERRHLAEELEHERDRLQASNQRIADILESIAEGYTALDREFRIVEANAAAETMHSLPRQQLVGRHLWDIFPNVRSTEFFRQYQLALSENRPVHFEAYTAQENKWYEVHAYPQPSGLDVYFHDISSRRRAENEIKQLYHDVEERAADVEAERARWRAALESIPDELWICDVDGRMSLMNPSAMNEMGIEEFQNRSLDEVMEELEMLNPDGQPRPEDQTPLLRSLHGETLRGEELVRNRRTGRLRFRQYTAAPIRNPQGAITGAIAIVRDITEQKRAEGEREKAEQALRDSEERFRNVLENSLDVAYRRNLRVDHYDYVSPVIEQLTGFSVNEFSAFAYEDVLARIHPDDQELIRAEVERTLGDESTATVEYRLLGKNGKYSWIADNFRVLKDDHGRPLYRVGIFRDVNASKLAEQEIQRLYGDVERRATQLEIANRELESFTYSVSHDLRTPLSAITNFANLLHAELGDQLPPDGQRYLTIVRENAGAMSQLIEALLRLSRLSRQPISKQSVDMTGLVKEVVEGLEQEHADRQIEFVIQDMPTVRGDPVLLKQVWSNLIANAIKFTRECDQAQIVIGCQHCEDADEAFFVHDNGVGFDMERADNLFGVFQRLHHEHDYEGHGVGLAIVERIVRRHGGRVWAEGEEGKGATFYFALQPTPAIHVPV